jgi:1-phosphofructokinase family hexose kinase
MFLTIGLNPVIQRTYVLPKLEEDAVNRCQSYRVDASGKGINVTRVLHQLGEAVIHLTQLGGRQRDYVLEMTRLDGLQIEWVDSQSEIRTCCTLLNEQRHTSTEIVEEAEPIANGTEDRLADRFAELCDQVRVVIISGTAAPGYTADLLPWMVRTAKERGLKTILDYRGQTLLDSLSCQPDVIKPNKQEFIQTFFPQSGEATASSVAEKMIELAEQHIQVILTDGRHDVMYTESGDIKTLPVPVLVPVNTIGCGDAFAAGLASGWIRNGDLGTGIQKGLWAAGQNARCLRPGSLV